MELAIHPAMKSVLRSLAALGVLILFAQTTHAEIACPAMMFNGKADQNDLSLTFMDTAKVPIRQLEFYCTPLGGHTALRSICHVETGIFYPGTPYFIRFGFTSKGAHMILVSLRSVQLSDTYLWTSTHDQTCHSLKISTRAK